MGLWRRLVGDRPIVTRLVLAVAGTMAAVLLVTGGFVFWRVGYALDRQVDQDLHAYQEVVEQAVADGTRPPGDTPGQSYQVYDSRGEVVAGNTTRALVSPQAVRLAAAGEEQREDVGSIFPAASHPYRAVTTRVRTPQGLVVVVAAISKNKHDEALRELLVQLVIAGLATLLAASLVGYRTARAALNPVERYRRAAESAGDDPVLPVAVGKDDEVTRLGHTFNALLGRVRAANARERRFLADASHELRSPLALMKTELEWALMAPRGDAETHTALASLAGQVDRLITLSNALLDLEELHGASSPLLERVEVAGLLDEVAARFSSTARAEERALVTDVPAGLVVDANRHWLELALGNLVSNSLRHGAGRVHLTASRRAGWIMIAVADEGPGFPAEFIGQAFDRFSRAETSRTTRGTGLGLALVQAVADAHHGTASITGSRVVLEIPDDAVTARRSASPR